tara:strand:+ start:18864 stop:20129 length:1266 start_codon:yes stop_codon:yes gene_type:complete
MKVAVFGLGNVGLVAALGLSEHGHDVIGVEISREKVEKLISKKLYIEEQGLAELLERNQHRISFTRSLDSLGGIDAVVVCVGTPTQLDGSVYLGQVIDTIQEISRLAGELKLDLVLRSTIPPGTIKKHLLPILKNNENISLYYHPEFLREGNAVEDFLYPDMHVVGVHDPKRSYTLGKLFSGTDNIKLVEFESAEMLKYLNNSFHALKVAYINEIASISSGYGVNVDELVDCFLSDTKLNISTKYLRPGFAFGGPCLTKDVSALDYLAKEKHIEAPIIASIIQSNNRHLFRSFSAIEKINPKTIVFFGASFKEGTNDLRSSPMMDLINMLQKRPSYIPKKEIYVRDNMIALEELKAKEVCRPAFNTSELPDKCDLLVLGAMEPTEGDLEYIENHEGHILDLCFNKNYTAPKSLKLKMAYDV